MTSDRHAALMAVIVPSVVGLIAERMCLSEVDALRTFVESRTYAALEDEATAVWHLSAESLYHMFEGECETGRVLFPEEV